MRTLPLVTPAAVHSPILAPAPIVHSPSAAPAPAPALLAPLRSEAKWDSPVALPHPAPVARSQDLSGRALLPSTDRARLDAAYAKATQDEKSSFVAIFTSPAFAKASSEDRHQIVALAVALRGTSSDSVTASHGTHAADSPLEALRVALDTPLDGMPRLMHPSIDGTSALHHLYTGLISRLNPDVAARLSGPTARALVAAVLQEIADPRRIDQGAHGTCTVTSMQSFMALRIPGEYARLTIGLGVDGSVRLANGQRLSADIDGIEPVSTGSRSVSERIFQGAIMQSAGTRGNYAVDELACSGFESTLLEALPDFWRVLCMILLPLGLILNAIRVSRGDGLNEREIVSAAQTLFNGREFLPYFGTAALDEVRRRVGINGDNDGLPHFIAMALNGGGHMMVLSRVDDTTTPTSLLVRNPWGSEDTRVAGDDVGLSSGGRLLPDDPTWEDPHAGLIRISLTPDNLERLSFIVMPK